MGPRSCAPDNERLISAACRPSIAARYPEPSIAMRRSRGRAAASSPAGNPCGSEKHASSPSRDTEAASGRISGLSILQLIEGLIENAGRLVVDVHEAHGKTES